MRLPHAAFRVQPMSTFVAPKVPKGRAFYRTDERCKAQVKAKHGMTKSCGKQALREVNGTWMCTVHLKREADRWAKRDETPVSDSLLLSDRGFEIEPNCPAAWTVEDWRNVSADLPRTRCEKSCTRCHGKECDAL